MPENFMPEGYNLDALVALVVQVVTPPAPLVVHVTPTAGKIHYVVPPLVNAMSFVNNEVYCHVPPPSESMGFYNRLDDFQGQFNEMQEEMKALEEKSYLDRMSVNSA